jgi:hypothetical protein
LAVRGKRFNLRAAVLPTAIGELRTMSILVVGSVAFDSIQTPFGKAERCLGGSATYFSVAASFFTEVDLVAVVGEDFSERDLDIFRGRRVNLDGLERVAGEKTFFWSG